MIDSIKRYSVIIILCLLAILSLFVIDKASNSVNKDYAVISAELTELQTAKQYGSQTDENRIEFLQNELIELASQMQEFSYVRFAWTALIILLMAWGIIEALIFLVTKINFLESESRFKSVFLGLAIITAAIILSSAQLNSNEIPKTAIELIKFYEGLELVAYPDPATNSKPFTIGYGTTKNVVPGMVITRETAERWLIRDLYSFDNYLRRTIKRPISKNEKSGLLSFVYNIGSLYGNMRRTVLAGSPEVPVWIRKYIRANGKILNGLIKRRNAEAEVYISNCEVIAKYNRCGCK